MNALPPSKCFAILSQKIELRAAICALAALVVFLAFAAIARAQVTSFAGVVVENTCNAQVQEPDQAAWKKIGLTRGVPRPLMDKEKVMCSPHTPGRVTLLVSKSYITIAGDQVYRVERGSALSDVVNYADLAATRGEAPPETIFTSPPSKGSIDPEHFVAHWDPPPKLKDPAITVESLDVSSKNSQLFDSGKLPAASGTLDSQALRDVLIKYRDRGGLSPLEMHLTDRDEHEYFVTFTVLTPPDTKKLASQLAEWDAEDGLVRHAGRASVYSSFGLHFEAAQETELALKESPQSPLLLQLAASAEERTGNSLRANELQKQLSQLTAKSR